MYKSSAPAAQVSSSSSYAAATCALTHADGLQGHQEPPSDTEVDALRAALEQARQEAGDMERALQAAQLESGLARQMLQACALLQDALRPGPCHPINGTRCPVPAQPCWTQNVAASGGLIVMCGVA